MEIFHAFFLKISIFLWIVLMTFWVLDYSRQERWQDFWFRENTFSNFSYKFRLKFAIFLYFSGRFGVGDIPPLKYPAGDYASWVFHFLQTTSIITNFVMDIYHFSVVSGSVTLMIANDANLLSKSKKIWKFAWSFPCEISCRGHCLF